MYTDINYIIHQSLKGDINAQEKLLKKLKPLLLRNIAKYSLKEDDIEDLLQEGYIVILNSLKSYNPIKNVHFLGYVKVNIQYFYINYFRNKTINYISLNNMSKEITNTTDSFAQLLEAEEIAELHECIKSLPIKDQNILTLFYKEEFSISKISDILNIPYRSVLGRKRNSIKKLRKMLEHSHGGD